MSDLWIEVLSTAGALSIFIAATLIILRPKR